MIAEFQSLSFRTKDGRRKRCCDEGKGAGQRCLQEQKLHQGQRETSVNLQEELTF